MGLSIADEKKSLLRKALLGYSFGSFCKSTLIYKKLYILSDIYLNRTFSPPV